MTLIPIQERSAQGIDAFGHDLLLRPAVSSHASSASETGGSAGSSDAESASAGQRPHRLDVRIHDTTRLEWISTVPLAQRGERRAYSVELTLDVPEHLWVAHALWPAFRARTRLQTPDHAVNHTRARTLVDDIRHEALRVGRRIKRHESELRAAVSAEADPLPTLERLFADAKRCRQRLRRAGDGDDRGAHTEARLASEYLSVALLSALARVHEALEPWPEACERLAAGVAAERAYRRKRGWPTPRGRGRRGLERWQRRRSALKKHFHQLLWLDAHEFAPDARLGNWIAAFVAVIASTWAFVWHVAYMNEVITNGTSAVPLFMAGAIAGILYAVKDRIKDVGRRWLSRRVREGIADKIVHLHLQERLDPRRGRLLTSRERLRAERAQRLDPLNPALGNTHTVMALSATMRLEQLGLDVPGDWGVGGLKHVMRYDLSALLPRLDQSERLVPVTRDDGRVRQAPVRKLYALQLRCTLRDEHGDAVVHREGELLLDHDGLRQLRLASPSD